MSDKVKYLTCPCNHCTQQLEFPADGVGTEIQCPNCGMTTRLYRPASVPIPPPLRPDYLMCLCNHCGQKVEFRAEMLDHQIACPSCGYQVPLKSGDSQRAFGAEGGNTAGVIQIPLKPGDSQRAQPLTPELTLPARIEESYVASVLSFIAVLELIAAPFAGFIVGHDNTLFGWMVFLSGLMGGLILLGFARVIEHLFESAQRLRRIEILLQKASDAKLRPNRSLLAPASAPMNETD
jgi:DNA-directed RNA polymerase subunit RPC12/RpoP